MVTALAPVNYCDLPPYRWYGVGEVVWLMERHAISRDVAPGVTTTALCGEVVTVDVKNPNRVGRRTCAECERRWRELTEMPERPTR